MVGLAGTPFVGARGTDSVQKVDAVHALALKAWGIDFVIRYLGAVTKSEVEGVLEAGLAFMPVTFGLRHGTPLNAALGATYGAGSVLQVKALDLPPGVTVWLDLEDCTGNADDVAAFVNAWCVPIKAAGFMPGLYVGAGAVLSGAQLYKLAVVRYWQSLSREQDAKGLIAEPGCGWCMIQLFDSQTVAGVWVDIDVIQNDYSKRMPVWTIAA